MIHITIIVLTNSMLKIYEGRTYNTHKKIVFIYDCDLLMKNLCFSFSDRNKFTAKNTSRLYNISRRSMHCRLKKRNMRQSQVTAEVKKRC